MICLQIGKPTILTQSDQSIKAFNPVSGVRDGFLEPYELNKLPLGFLAVLFLNPRWNTRVFLVPSIHPLRSRSSLSSPKNRALASLRHVTAPVTGHYRRHLFGTILFAGQWTRHRGQPSMVTRSCLFISKVHGARQPRPTHWVYVHLSLYPSHTLELGAHADSSSLLTVVRISFTWQGGEQTGGAEDGQTITETGAKTVI